MIFDGETNQLLTTVLQPGTVHASYGVLAVLKRLIPALQARWPGVLIELRADSGFAIPALYDFCEAQGIDYTLLLHTAAYWLLDTLRRWLTNLRVPRMQFDTLRSCLIKIGGWVQELLTRVRLRLASRYPGEPLWRLLTTRTGGP